jgi:hypothetical protein
MLHAFRVLFTNETNNLILLPFAMKVDGSSRQKDLNVLTSTNSDPYPNSQYLAI